VLRHLPNILSAARIPASLALLVTFDPSSPPRLWISLAIVIAIMGTDFLDGHIARRYSITSKFGYVLDGLGDRAVHVAIYLILLKAGTLIELLVWGLIFREILQYAIRLVDDNWHSGQSKTDRAITQAYSVTVHVALLAELGRTLTDRHDAPLPYAVVVNLVLGTIAALSYWRVMPRLFRAWRAATEI